MLTIYVPGTGLFHRLPTGVKGIIVLALVLGASFLPSTWCGAALAAALLFVSFAVAGIGDGPSWWRYLWRQLWAIRWVMLIMAVGQLIFMGLEPAIANTARVSAAITLAALLPLTTPVTLLLDSLERGLRPLAYVRVSPERVAVLLTVTLTTVPVLARLGAQVREAQRARGGRADLRTFIVPFLILALKHADELGDALSARGVR